MKRLKLFICIFFLTCFVCICPAQNISWSGTQGPYSTTINVFDTAGATIYAGTKAGLYASTNSGGLWSPVPSIPGITFDIARNGTNIYVAGASGVTFSSDQGVTWVLRDSGLPLFPLVLALKNTGDTLYSCLGGQGFFRSTNGGKYWSQPSSDISNKTINTMIITGTSLIVAEGAGILRSVNKGFSWIEPSGVIADQAIHSFVLKDNQIFAGTETGVFRSSDDGLTWQPSGTGMNPNDIVTSLTVSSDGKTIFAGTTDLISEVGIYRSNDGGNTWQLINNGLSNLSIYSLFALGSEIYAGTDLGISRSDNNGDLWQTISDGLPKPPVTSLAAMYDLVFAGTSGSYLFTSGDAGEHWQQNRQGLSRKNVNAVLTIGLAAFAGTDGIPKQDLGGVHRSTNYGNSWTQINNGIPVTSIISLANLGSQIFAACDSGIYTSNDNGNTWSKFDTLIAETLYSNDTALYLSTKTGSVLWNYTNNSGWSQVAYKGPNIQAVIRNGGNIFVGTDSGIYKDSALTWVRVTGDTLNVRSLWTNNIILAAGTTKGIYLSSNNGTSWQFQQSAGTDTVNTFAATVHNLYAGTNAGVIGAALLQYSVSSLPQANPLSLRVTNPSTVQAEIYYKIIQAGNTSLTVYDLLGKECSQIFSDRRDVGEYNLEWNTSTLATGIYMLRLVSGGNQASTMINVVH